MRHWRLFALAAVGFGCIAQPLLGQVNRVIYDGNLENGWEDWGWASVISFTSTDSVYGSEPYSISVTCENTPTSYEALYLENSVNTTPFGSLSFWINGGPNGGQPLNVYGLINGSAQTAYTLPVLPGSNTWTNIVIPLTALGVANTTCDGFWWQAQDGHSNAPFYLDDIMLVGGSAPPPTGTNPVNLLVIDCLSNLHTPSVRLFTASPSPPIRKWPT